MSMSDEDEASSAPGDPVPAEANYEVLNGYFVFGEPAADGKPVSFYDGDYILIDGVQMRHGMGKYFDGVETYNGEWVRDCMEGSGIQTFASGASYHGEFVNNKYHGKGTYVWPDRKTKYVGEWSNGLFHGEGMYVDIDEVEWKGDFWKGKYESPIDVDFGELARQESRKDLSREVVIGVTTKA
jgi:hypothetical protein